MLNGETASITNLHSMEILTQSIIPPTLSVILELISERNLVYRLLEFDSSQTPIGILPQTI